MFHIDDVVVSGRSVLPLVEGGKGIAVSTGETAGAWANAGGVGTFSAVNADFFNENNELVNCIYTGKTRLERRVELIKAAIKGGITQAQIAHDIAGNNGRIHMNVLWEMGASQEILNGILEKTKGLVHGVTCGAGMPYKLAEIAASHGVFYYPIVSSARAFSALFRRAYSKFSEFLGGVVYEDPWLAGGHNGISNAEDPNAPQSPYDRLVEIRAVMNQFGLEHIPIIIAGGVWWLKEWGDYIRNSQIGKIAFQFGTRPLLVKENPISKSWHKILTSLKKGDVKLTQFSPTGFYSSAVNNSFLKELQGLTDRQIILSEDGDASFMINNREYKMSKEMADKASQYVSDGYTVGMLTPDNTMVFATEEHAARIRNDQRNCCCCLSRCRFSSWCENESGTTGLIPDPRTFCIQKTLQSVAHGGDPEHELVFSGHSAYRFATDPFYANGFIPTTQELIDRIMTGE